MWSTYHTDDPVLPCDDTGECIGTRCYRLDDCEEPIKVVCDDDCNECPESGPLPEVFEMTTIPNEEERRRAGALKKAGDRVAMCQLCGGTALRDPNLSTATCEDCGATTTEYGGWFPPRTPKP